MNFLALCQRLVRESPVTGNGPASVIGQSGTMQQVVGWINTASLDIQSLHPEWRFMTGDVSFPTEIGKAVYTAAEAGIMDLATWSVKDCDMRVYNSISNEQFLAYLPWDDFRAVYVQGTSRTQTGTPEAYTVKPDNSIMFYPIPDKVYTIDGQYFKAPQEMTGNTDLPPFPETYHMAIVWSALMMYCAFDSISDLYAPADSKYRKLVRKLEMEQLPRMRYGAPLA